MALVNESVTPTIVETSRRYLPTPFVWPRGAQVNEKPNSSSNIMSAPSRRAFFICGQSRLNQARISSSSRSRARRLHTPVQRLHQSPDIFGMVGDAKLAGNHLLNPPLRPAVSGKPMGTRSLFEHANQALTLIGRQLARRPASLETSQSRLGQLLLPFRHCRPTSWRAMAAWLKRPAFNKRAPSSRRSSICCRVNTFGRHVMHIV